MSAQQIILVVEDDSQMRIGIEDNLSLEGYRVETASSCAQARQKMQRTAPDLILLDRMLPDGDSVDYCRELREAGFRNSIIMLTAKGEEFDKVIGLESGADDYVVKPFSLRELLARIHAHLRRDGRRAEIEGSVRVGAAEVDFTRHKIVRDGQELEISARELEVLRFLVARRGQVVSRDCLLEKVWERPQDVVTRTVDNFIVRLRKKIEYDHANPRVLLTVHGSGYKLVDE